MDSAEVRRHLEETHALLTGHFVLSSGLHSRFYIQCAQVLAWPARAALLGAALGERWDDLPVDVVVGPALGGIIIAHEVARYLGTPCLFTERQEGRMLLRRGFQVGRGAKVLVVEDVVTTGGSAREVIEVVRAAQAEVVGVGAIVWRSPPLAEGEKQMPPFGAVPLRALLEMSVDARPPRECPQCRAGKPVEKPGSRLVVPAKNRDAS